MKVGDKVIYGKTMSKDGAANPNYVGQSAVVTKVAVPHAGVYEIQFEDGTVHRAPYFWITPTK